MITLLTLDLTYGTARSEDNLGKLFFDSSAKMFGMCKHSSSCREYSSASRKAVAKVHLIDCLIDSDEMADLQCSVFGRVYKWTYTFACHNICVRISV